MSNKLNVYLVSNMVFKEFCQAKKIQKIREKLRSGWVGQAPTRTFLCVFCVFLFVHVSQNIWIGGELVLSGQSEFSSDFSIFLNLTRPLS